jgi:hypothetical protein
LKNDVSLDGIYIPSPDVVAREIEGELIIVPLTAGIGDLEDELYTVSETGKAIWDLLDGRRSVREIAADLATSFEGSASEIEQDVMGFLGELLRRRMLAEG